MLKIHEMLLDLEDFQYATSLYLNMGYYCIHISNQVSNLCMIIIYWGKYGYKRLSMKVSNYPNIF